jgi:ATP-dependent DNA ligase
MRVACDSEELVSFFTNASISDHGEGVIMRKPHSSYISGRSRFLYKLKVIESNYNILSEKVFKKKEGE